MNSLAWLLAGPRSRASSLDRVGAGADGQRDGDSRKSRSKVWAGVGGRTDKGKRKATAEDLAHGPRETESEAVDELLGAVERDRGVAAANQIERKASMGTDGQVRLGVPGITERRRTRGLELVLDGGEGRSALETDSDRDEDRITSTDDEGGRRRRSRQQTPEDAVAEAQDLPQGDGDASPTRPSMTPVELPPLPPSPMLQDRAQLAFGEDDATSSPSAPPPVPPPTPGIIRPAPRLPLLHGFGSRRPSPTRKPSSPEQRSRIVARSAPVRWTISLYLALRRFLTLFGIKLPRAEDAVMIKAPDEKDPLIEKPDVKTSPSSFLPFMRRSAPLRPPIVEATDEKADSRRHRSASVASNASSDPGFESDGSLISSRIGHKASWFGRIGGSDRSGTATPTELVGKIAPGASGKKLEALLRKPKTLVLDLDETLIHSTSRLGGMGGVSAGAGGWGGGAANGLKVRVVEVVLDGRIVVYHVYKRPWVDFFLKKVGALAPCFTASPNAKL